MRLALLLACLAAPASAQQIPQCAPHADMARHLAEGWGESRQSLMLDAGGGVVELYASTDTGTWTLTITRPGQPTCMVASGSAYEVAVEVIPEGERM